MKPDETVTLVIDKPLSLKVTSRQEENKLLIGEKCPSQSGDVAFYTIHYPCGDGLESPDPPRFVLYRVGDRGEKIGKGAMEPG